MGVPSHLRADVPSRAVLTVFNTAKNIATALIALDVQEVGKEGVTAKIKIGSGACFLAILPKSFLNSDLKRKS